MKKLSIVVLAQHSQLLTPCLSAIGRHTASPFELIIVNDAAGPELHRLPVLNEFPGCRVIDLPQLHGVAAGYNRGIAAASGERLVLMRDHVLVTAGWLEALVDCLDAHPDGALAGPVSNDVSGWQRPAAPIDVLLTADRAERLRLAGQSEATLRVPRLLSFLLMADKETFSRLGGLDERFAIESYEDDDLCYRALRAGYSLYVALDSFALSAQPPSLFPNEPDWYRLRLEENRRLAELKWGVDLSDALHHWKRPVSISLCMIVKNEEATLARCLSSVAGLVDEIVILDTGSTDRTKEIAAEFHAHVHDFVWINDFAAARNRAFELASKEYILWLDADDVLKPEDQEKFRSLASALPWSTDAVSMVYNLAHDAFGNVTASLRRNRLVRRSRGFRWIGIVHEYLEVYGSILPADIAVTHDRQHTQSSRNLNIYEQRLADGATFTPRDWFYFSNELFDHQNWSRAAEHYERFLALAEGWVEDKISACGRAAECYFNLGDKHRARERALASFAYALPRAENCCRLGSFYLSDGQYAEAAWWYKLATTLAIPADMQAPVQHACWTWLPHLQLCVCYDRLGQYELADKHNELAGAWLPGDQRIAMNRAYLAGRLASAL